MDRYYETFFSNETQAQHELDLVSVDYAETGMYPCEGGFLVWADRNTEREL